MSIEGQLEKERYDEAMYERLANGVPKITFAQWRMNQARLSMFFDELKAERERSRQRAVDRSYAN